MSSLSEILSLTSPKLTPPSSTTLGETVLSVIRGAALTLTVIVLDSEYVVPSPTAKSKVASVSVLASGVNLK